MKNLKTKSGVIFATFLILASIPATTMGVSTMNLYIINGRNQISKQVFPTSSPSSLKPASLRGFVNQTIGNLFLSEGTIDGQITTSYRFQDTTEEGVVQIIGAVRASSSFIYAIFTPHGTDLQLGDGFIVNYTSSLGHQLRGLARGLDHVGRVYARSSDTNLRLLGRYYDVVADSFERLQEVLPHRIQNLRVSATLALVLDDYWGCLIAIAEYAIAAAVFIANCVTPAVIVVINCIIATAALITASFNMVHQCQ